MNADRWLYEKITTDAQLAAALGGRVYVDLAPQDTEYPFAVTTFISAQQVGNWSQDRVMDNELWQVALWTDGASYLALEPIADRLRTVLHKASGSGVVSCAFERQLRMSDPEGYKAILMEFRLFTQ